MTDRPTLLQMFALLTPMQPYDLNTLLHINPALDVLQISPERIQEVNDLLIQFNHRLIEDSPALGDYVLAESLGEDEPEPGAWAMQQISAGAMDLMTAWTINTPANKPPAGAWLVQLNKSPIPPEADEYSQVLRAIVFMTEPTTCQAAELVHVGYVRRLIRIDNDPDTDGTVSFYVPVKVWRHIPEPPTIRPTYAAEF